MAWFNVKLKDSPEMEKIKNAIGKPEQFRCKVIHASLNKNRIYVLLLFPDGRTAVSYIESSTFLDNFEWLGDDAEESYADVTVEAKEVKRKPSYLFTDDVSIMPNFSPCPHIGRVFYKLKVEEILKKPEYKVEIKIDCLHLKKDCMK